MASCLRDSRRVYSISGHSAISCHVEVTDCFGSGTRKQLFMSLWLFSSRALRASLPLRPRSCRPRCFFFSSLSTLHCYLKSESRRADRVGAEGPTCERSDLERFASGEMDKRRPMSNHLVRIPLVLHFALRSPDERRTDRPVAHVVVFLTFNTCTVIANRGPTPLLRMRRALDACALAKISHVLDLKKIDTRQKPMSKPLVRRSPPTRTACSPLARRADPPTELTEKQCNNVMVNNDVIPIAGANDLQKSPVTQVHDDFNRRRQRDMAENFPTDQFSLRWNNFTNNLTSGFMSHLSDKDLVDVTLAVDGQLLQAHKLVLSVCSPYFKDIFKAHKLVLTVCSPSFKDIFKCNPCQHPVVILKDMGYAEVESLLRFMYQGEVNVRQEELASFLKVAEILQIKGLTSESGENRNDFIKEEDRASSRSDTLKSDQDSDSNDLQRASRRAVNSDGPVRRRKSRSSAAQGTNSAKRSRTSVSALRDLDVPVASPAETGEAQGFLREDGENDDTKLSSKRNSDDFSMEHDDNDTGIFAGDSIDLTKDDNAEERDEDRVSENRAKGDNSGPVVEPVTYRLSARGRPQLIHEGYVYNLTSRSEVLNRSHYRCAEQHRGCRGKCAVIAERFMPTGVHEHNHAPGYQSENDYRKKKGFDAEQN